MFAWKENFVRDQKLKNCSILRYVEEAFGIRYINDNSLMGMSYDISFYFGSMSY
jgi:hypothetical protein